MIDVKKTDDATLLDSERFFFAYRAFTAPPDAMLAERGLARVHHRILFFVARRPGQRVSELLTTLGVSKQAVHGPLRQLVGEALVRVEADPEDGRGRRLFLTPAGEALEQALSAPQCEMLGRLFEALGPEKAAGWREGMAILARKLAPGQA